MQTLHSMSVGVETLPPQGVAETPDRSVPCQGGEVCKLCISPLLSRTIRLHVSY